MTAINQSKSPNIQKTQGGGVPISIGNNPPFTTNSILLLVGGSGEVQITPKMCSVRNIDASLSSKASPSPKGRGIVRGVRCGNGGLRWGRPRGLRCPRLRRGSGFHHFFFKSLQLTTDNNFQQNLEPTNSKH